jgi:hypothetical protein
VSSGPRPSEPAAIFREEALRSLSDPGADGDGDGSAMAQPAGPLRQLWIAAAGLSLALLVITVRIVQMSR